MPLRAHVQFTPFDASSGAALTSATVNVFQPGTVTPVTGTLFDKSGGTLSNPLTSDATTGLVDFYMNVAQEVDLQVAKSGFTTRTYSNVPVLDDAGNDLTALMTGTGDIVYASTANTPARLASGPNLSVLGIAASVPSYSPAGAANQALMVNAAGNALAWGPPAFSTWTPTITQNAVSLALSVATGWYVQIGKLVIATALVTVNASGTGGFAIILGALPVNAQQRGAAGFGDYFPNGIGRYVVTGVWQSATTVAFASGSAVNGLFGATPNITCTAGDTLRFSLVYEST